MKKIGIFSVITIVSLIILFSICTVPVDNAPYFESDYFKNSCSRIDSLKECTMIVNDSIQAGFAKISITPGLNSAEDNYPEGKFIHLPLAGYGARKGKSATGIHDSIFVKAVALKINQQILVLLSADLLIMPPNITDSVTI